ncbi:unnamed protein product, partial [Mesorhabditis belari]|uniref:Uncharacterized protein n=1 Tax=Mesorhabditis belari TaxID=2138241 RepID=A0AAF3FPH9_9BILA
MQQLSIRVFLHSCEYETPPEGCRATESSPSKCLAFHGKIRARTITINLKEAGVEETLQWQTTHRHRKKRRPLRQRKSIQALIRIRLKFPIPKWATRPPGGFHLDVACEERSIAAESLHRREEDLLFWKKIQNKLMLLLNTLRVLVSHALLIYHETLQRFALVDLGSSHGIVLWKSAVRAIEPLFLEPGAEVSLGRLIEEGKMMTNTKSTQSTDIQLEQVTEYNYGTESTNHGGSDLSNEGGTTEKTTKGAICRPFGRAFPQSRHNGHHFIRFGGETSESIVGTGASTRRKLLRPTREASRYQAPISTTLNITLNTAPDLELYKALPEPITESMTPMKTLFASLYIVDDREDNAPHKKKYAKGSWPERKPQGMKHLMRIFTGGPEETELRGPNEIRHPDAMWREIFLRCHFDDLPRMKMVCKKQFHMVLTKPLLEEGSM